MSLLLLLAIKPTLQQNDMCPNLCTCDEQSLEILCKGNLRTSGIPHTLNPGARRLTMNATQTSQFSGLDYLTKLEAIDLSNNKIASLDFNFISKNNHLASLNTSHNVITELKDQTFITALTEQGITLESLEESLKTIDPKSIKFTKVNVVELTLNHNLLTILKDFIFIRFHRLQRLDLSHNLISVLEPSCLFGLNRLEVLNLRSNRLTQVPTLSLLNSLFSLTYSNFHHTKPSTIRYLDLSQNTLSALTPDSFHSLDALQELHLERCSIETIHEQAFRGMHALNHLSLDENLLQEVPSKSFGYITILRHLRLNSNNITQLLASAFSELSNLEDLQISNAQLNRLEKGAIVRLASLRKLEITGNPELKVIEKGVLEDLPKLNYLNLSYNSLSSLPEINSQRDTLQTLDLRGNKLVCLCELKWLTRWFKRKHNELTNQENHKVKMVDLHASIEPYELLNLTCQGPPALEKKRVIDLPDIKFECMDPSSDLNVQIGFASLFFISFIMSLVCLSNLFQNSKVH